MALMDRSEEMGGYEAPQGWDWGRLLAQLKLPQGWSYQDDDQHPTSGWLRDAKGDIWIPGAGIPGSVPSVTLPDGTQVQRYDSLRGWAGEQRGFDIMDYAPIAAAAAFGGAALGGAFPGIDLATGAYMPAGTTGIFGAGAGGVADATGAFDMGQFTAGDVGLGGDVAAGLGGGLDAGATGAFDMGQFTGADVGLGGGGSVTGGASQAAQTASKSALERFLKGEATASDYAQLAGTLGSTALGVAGANAQQGAMQDVANQYLALGEPYRAKLLESYGPGFNLAGQSGYGDAFQRMADISARSYSAKMGNPADSPTAQAGILGDVWNQSYLPALSNYRGQLGQFGQLGLNTSGAASMQGAGNSGDLYNALGYGLGQLTQPQNSLEDLLKRYGVGGGLGLPLNMKGTP